MRIRLLLLLPVLVGLTISSLHGQTVYGDLTFDEIGPGEYSFKLTNLPLLDPTEPAEVHSDPQYQIFVETGDGYYFREMVEPDQTEFSFNYGYSKRPVQEPNVNVYMTPLYSPNKRPGIPDMVFPGGGLQWSPGAAGNSLKYDFMNQSEMAYADLNWFSFEPSDTIVVVAGYQNVNPDIDLSDGAIVSIYYDSNVLSPVTAASTPVYRSYNEVNPTTYNFEEDPVLDQYGEYVNAHIDFDAQGPDQGVEEFIYANFKLADSEEVGEEAGFKIVVVVRAGGNQQVYLPSYRAASVDGEIKTVRDPNSITGRPNPLCMESAPDFIEYDIEFFNSGEAIAKKFDLDIELSDYISLVDQSDIEITFLRIGNDTLTDLNAELVAKPELINNAPPRVIWSIQPVAPDVYLSGFGSTELEFNPSFYYYCSAEVKLRVPRNKALESCDSIPAKLTITFENGIPVARADAILCNCEQPTPPGPDPQAFPCNIVPDIPFLGGCWCTLLVILLLIVIVFLIIVIRRNSSGN